MSDGPYIRNPKGNAGSGGKFGINEQDIEDFKQERQINEWLEREGKSGAIELKHISGKGTARNTLLKAAFSLDAKVSDQNGGRTFADIIPGFDGRDLEIRIDSDEFIEGPASAADRLEDELNLFFEAIGVPEETKLWAKKTIKSAPSLRSLRSLMNEDKQSEISQTSLELEPL